MNPQSKKELTEKALSARFSFMLSRKEVLVLRTLVLQQQYNLADAEILIPVVKLIETTALNSLTETDYLNTATISTAEISN